MNTRAIKMLQTDGAHTGFALMLQCKAPVVTSDVSVLGIAGGLSGVCPSSVPCWCGTSVTKFLSLEYLVPDL